MKVSQFRRFLARSGLLAILAIAGCGGGAQMAGVDSGGTGSFAVGTIGGFGSIIVNDIRYDDSRATVRDAYGRSRSTADLRLGMVVEVEGSVLAPTPAGALYVQEGVATDIRLGGDIVGPLQAANQGASQITVLGQTVDLAPTTIYGDELAGGLPTLATLPLGSILEVHGFPAPASNGRYTATRVDLRPAADEYRLVGTVHDHDLGSRRFSIGETRIDYAALSIDEARSVGVIEGASARVRIGTVPRLDGTWVMLQAQSAAPMLADHEDVDIEGLVTAVDGTVAFTVNGVPVDASRAVIEPAAARFAVGVRITVSGSLRGGVLVADLVRVEPVAAPDGTQARRRITLSGPVAALTLDGLQLRVRGVRVNLAEAIFEGGILALLRNGISVEVEGRLALDGSSVDATRIRFVARGSDGSPARGNDDRNPESPGNSNAGNGNRSAGAGESGNGGNRNDDDDDDDDKGKGKKSSAGLSAILASLSNSEAGSIQ
ncbi:MAG: hypothetical protein H0T52_08450 [Lautropia sp.]|nr:hypothetical protein [Lautropia sp.]